MSSKYKVAFENWMIESYWKNVRRNELPKIREKLDRVDLLCFYNHRDSEKFGVYVDFFDSVGIHITDGSGRFKLGSVYYYWVIELEGKPGSFEGSDTNKTREESRSDAIKKAVELYNKLY